MVADRRRVREAVSTVSVSHPPLILRIMKQLVLIDPPQRTPWKLDKKTIETGRKGLAQAREALRQANERQQQAA